MKSPEILFDRSKILPVVVSDDEKKALGVAQALFKAGINVMEITLRTERALEGIAAVARHIPEMTVGAGTVLNVEQWQKAQLAGAKFMVSPGLTTELLEFAQRAPIPYLPGVSTCSEMMLALSYGFTRLKLFPAAVVGGVSFLKAVKGPFPQLKFCPTGGIDGTNARDFLALDNVFAIGGSWMVPQDLVAMGDFVGIEALARKASFSD